MGRDGRRTGRSDRGEPRRGRGDLDRISRRRRGWRSARRRQTSRRFHPPRPWRRWKSASGKTQSGHLFRRAQERRTAGHATRRDRRGDAGVGPEGLERCSAAEHRGERVLFRRCSVCQGGAGARGARVPRCARVPGPAAREEREHGEKVLYCEACRGGPFNTKGMRMHISRWCAYAPGERSRTRGESTASRDEPPEAAARDVAAAKTAKNNAAKKGGAGEKGSGGKKRSGGADTMAEDGGENEHLPRVRRRAVQREGHRHALESLVQRARPKRSERYGRRVRKSLGGHPRHQRGATVLEADEELEPQLSPSLGLPGSVGTFSTGGLDLGALFKNMNGATPPTAAPGPGTAGGFARG